jgi:hypothetical protein
MIDFTKTEDTLYLNYTAEGRNIDENWITARLEENQSFVIHLKKTFSFEKKDLVPVETDDEDAGIFDPLVYSFILGALDGEYYLIKPGFITRRTNVYIHNSVEVDLSYFIADIDISVLKNIEELIAEDIYIGGDHPSAIPVAAYENIIANFPTTYEKKTYAQARVTAILKNYLESTTDSEAKYQRYMNKKTSRQNADLKKTFQESETFKYRTMLQQLEAMLHNELDYSEHEWQNEILQIIQLLYPKYIAVLSKVKIQDKHFGDRELDFLLVDTNGHIDIVEIKKPFNKSIITESKYRNNHIPLRELSGTVMQLEKYIFFLNRWGKNGEEVLSNRYRQNLPENLELKITNPGGLIIMGRDDKLTGEQLLDFEIVKRKYKNVVDIITYDSLIRRLKITLEQIQKL